MVTGILWWSWAAVLGVALPPADDASADLLCARISRRELRNSLEMKWRKKKELMERNVMWFCFLLKIYSLRKCILHFILVQDAFTQQVHFF